MPGRIRTIKPEWREDEKMSHATDAARVLSVGLITLADDYGNGRADIGRIQGEVWPVSGESHENFTKLYRKTQSALKELVEMRFVVLYQVDGQHYFAIRNWARHQKVQHPGKPQVPAPPDALMNDSGESHETLTPDLRPTTYDQDQRVASRGDAREVFDHWAKSMDRKRVVYDSKREARIKARLKEGFTVAQLCQAIDGATKSDWHMGRDPKTNGKLYNGIETILRDAAQVEKMIELSGGATQARNEDDELANSFLS